MTLTTNLIADCMALIPQNLERLNQNTNKYKFISLHGQQMTATFGVLSHCLRTIPEFQTENPELAAELKNPHRFNL